MGAKKSKQAAAEDMSLDAIREEILKKNMYLITLLTMNLKL